MMTAREKAQHHAKYPHHCSCGRVVFGNGGKAQHFPMHKRRGDGHHAITATEYSRRVAAGEITPRRAAWTAS